MNQEVTSFTIDGEEYLVLDQVHYQNKTYLWLFKEENPKEFLIQEFRKESPEILFGIPEEEYPILLEEFIKRHKK